MRSRFAAYARGDVEYLWRTLHSDHEDRAAPREQFVRTAKHACATYKYMRLRIVEACADEVLFRASVFEKGRDISFLELSTFARDDGAWRYLRGVMRAADDRAWTPASFVSHVGD
jgi:SEC-C motif-containing protein